MILPVKTKAGGYDITIGRDLLRRAGEFFSLSRKVLIVTDSGVPAQYAETAAACCASPVILTLPCGEATKCMDSFIKILSVLTENGFTRTDCVLAVGGGVVGDLAGFASACYMRGIDFFNIPTTVLSQVDSSIGGKTAVDFGGYKNIVGAFHQPKGVLIDFDTLGTLPPRQVSNGLAEALKMGMTSDAALFALFEEDPLSHMDEIIERAIRVKRAVVEEDEEETGLRKVLNFGHTLAHALETANGMETLFHGECVALGMIPMCTPEVRERLIPVLRRLSLPTEISADAAVLCEAVRHDKKASGDSITVIYVQEIGSFRMEKMPIADFEKRIREVTEQ